MSIKKPKIIKIWIPKALKINPKIKAKQKEIFLILLVVKILIKKKIVENIGIKNRLKAGRAEKLIVSGAGTFQTTKNKTKAERIIGRSFLR